MDNDINNLITTSIKKRNEVYFLVTDKDLNSLRNSSIIADFAVILASIFLSSYFSDNNSYAFFAGILFIIIAIVFHYLVSSLVKELKSSGEVQSVNFSEQSENLIKNNVKKNDSELSDSNAELIIVDATYFTPGRSINVTKILREKVYENKLIVTASNDLFGDPDEGKRKKLFILYQYKGVEISKMFNEGDNIEIP